MKYVLILGDGMADYPVPMLNNKTPLQAAKKPNIDYLVKRSAIGLVKTIPDNLSPGSDVANLSIMGYNPNDYYSGRSPIEAVSMGIQLSDSDVALRCNLVTLSNEESYNDKTMIDYCSDEITTKEANELILELNARFKTNEIIFYPGISYRHLMLWKNGSTDLNSTPPHDILNKKISPFLTTNPAFKNLLDLMIKSPSVLKDHPINKSRIRRGVNPANSIWLWGEGKKLSLPSFYSKFGLRGSVISAVDLIKGIGMAAGLNSVNVDGATGNIHTNFLGKALAVLKELENDNDFIYLHIEAPDECGHQGQIENKVKSIELIDQLIVGTLLEKLEKYDDYKILFLPDHATPLTLRTHTRDPVPYLIYQKSKNQESMVDSYHEFEQTDQIMYINQGSTLLNYFF